jgi:hypothetical protein
MEENKDKWEVHDNCSHEPNKETLEAMEEVILTKENKQPIDTIVLDNFAEIVKRRNSRVSACVICGDEKSQLIRVSKQDKLKGFICRTCLMSLPRDRG